MLAPLCDMVHKEFILRRVKITERENKNGR